MRTGSFRGVKSGRGVTLTPHPLLVPLTRKSRAIPLFPLWAVRPVQSHSACTRVHFTFTSQFPCKCSSENALFVESKCWLPFGGRDSNSLRAGRLGFWTPGRGETFPVRPKRHRGPPSLLYYGHYVTIPEVNWPESCVDHSPPSIAEVRERVEVYLSLSLCLHGMSKGELYLEITDYQQVSHKLISLKD